MAMEMAMQASSPKLPTIQDVLSELADEHSRLEAKIHMLGERLTPVMSRSETASLVSNTDTPQDISPDAPVFDGLRDAVRFVGRLQTTVNEMLDRVQL